MDTTAVLDLAVEIGYQLQMSGGEIYRVEESVNRVLAAYGIQSGEVFAIPNCIFASLTAQGETLTRVRRVGPHGTDIWRLEAVNALCRRLCRVPLPPEQARRELEEVLAGETLTRVRRVGPHGTDIWRLEAVNALCRRLCRIPLPPEEARRELDEVLAEETHYSLFMILLAHFIVGATFCLFFGGSGADALCAGACGVAIGLCLWLMDRLGANPFVKTIAAGAASALLALGLVALGAGKSADLITIGALMLLVPGIALTNAVRDIMAGDMVSGLSRLAEAMLIAVAIALGTGLALTVGRMVGGAL